MKKNLTFILLIALMAGLVFFTHAVQTYAQSEDGLTATGGVDTSSIVLIVAQLQGITLDTSIFTSPEFLSLSDYTVPVVPIPISRQNPFAPLGQN